MKQVEIVLDYMAKHGGITRMEAFQIGIANLPARISDLNQLGFEICKVWHSGENRYGANVRWIEYRLGREEDYVHDNNV